jgi:hypothetical protein
MTRATRIALFWAAILMATATPATAATTQDCHCPSGYDPTTQCGTFCAAEPVKKAPCPEDATYDDNLALCTADPGADGQCPKGMSRPFYNQRCTSPRRTNEYACPSGGHFDKDKGYCTAPCMINGDSRTREMECTALRNASDQ